MIIPEVQSELRYWADSLTGLVPPEDLSHVAARLRALADELSRRPSRSRAPNDSARVTPELRGRMREYALAHPEMTELAIGKEFRVNQGRVSEALKGFRR